MGKVFNMVGGGGGAGSPDLPIGSRINVTSDIGATIDIAKGSLHYQKVVTSPHSLPSGYTELDCVVTPDNNTTTYMVLTDVLVNAGYTVEVKFELTRFNTTQTYSCIAGRNSNLQFAISGSGYIGNGNMSYSSTYKVNLNEPFTIKGKFVPSGDNYIYLNGTKTDIWRASNESNTLCLFYHGNSASVQNCFATGKCYWVKVYNNSNVLVKEMIPCRNSSDVVGFYDIVNNVFMPPTGGAFTGEEISQGTVTFTVNYSGTWQLSASKSGKETLTDTVSVLADDTDYNKSMNWRVPSAYQEVEYIESHGAEYIITDIVCNNITSIETVYKKTSSSTLMALCGGNYNISNINYATGIMLNNSYRGTNIDIACKNYQANCGYYLTVNIGEFHKGFLDASVSPAKFYVDNVLGTLKSGETTTVSNPLYLFWSSATTPSANPWTKANVQLKSIKIITTTGNYDFIPCYRKSDSVAGLWDTVNKVFYDNDGTGTFTVGGDV